MDMEQALTKEFDSQCPCGSPSGDNPDCDRCELFVAVKLLRWQYARFVEARKDWDLMAKTCDVLFGVLETKLTPPD